MPNRSPENSAPSGPPQSPAPLITSFFSIRGWDFDTSQCTDAIGLAPSGIWHQRHSEIRQSHPEVPTTNWFVEVADRPLYSIDDGLAELLEIVWPARERIRNFLAASGLEGFFCSHVRIYDDRPLWELKPVTLSKLAWLGCEWGMDLYDYRD